MKRGDIITVAVSGDFGKPRPATIVQNDDISGVESVLVCPLTTDDRLAATFRFTLEPSKSNGLRAVSIVMPDKIMVVRRLKCGPVIGALTAAEMMRLDACISLVFGLDT